jgi:hypothetical protein
MWFTDSYRHTNIYHIALTFFFPLNYVIGACSIHTYLHQVIWSPITDLLPPPENLDAKALSINAVQEPTNTNVFFSVLVRRRREVFCRRPYSSRLISAFVLCDDLFRYFTLFSLRLISTLLLD